MKELGAEHPMKGKEFNAIVASGHEKDIVINGVKYGCCVPRSTRKAAHWIFPGDIIEENEVKANARAKKTKAYRDYCEANFNRGKVKEMVGA